MGGGRADGSHRSTGVNRGRVARRCGPHGDASRSVAEVEVFTDVYGLLSRGTGPHWGAAIGAAAIVALAKGEQPKRRMQSEPGS